MMVSIRALLVAIAVGAAAGTLAALSATLEETNGHVLPATAAPPVQPRGTGDERAEAAPVAAEQRATSDGARATRRIGPLERRR